MTMTFSRWIADARLVVVDYKIRKEVSDEVACSVNRRTGSIYGLLLKHNVPGRFHWGTSEGGYEPQQNFEFHWNGIDTNSGWQVPHG
jgi:hypothetical protein